MSKGTQKVVEFPDREAIELEAATWIVRQGEEDFGVDGAAALAAWLKASERHRDAYRRLTSTWEAAEVLRELDDIADSVEVPAPDALWSPARRGALLAMAAALLLAVGVVQFGVLPQRPQPDPSRDYVTAVGEQRTIDLADGTVVRLNTDTALSVHLADDARRVRLLQGEAFFEVAHDPDRPFTVSSRAGSVRAVGTAFATRLKDREVLEVTVAEGRVEVTFQSDQPDLAAAPQSAPVEVAAGNTVLYSRDRQEVAPASETEIDRKLSWRDGVVIFAGESLRTVVDDVSRYTDLEISIADERLESLPIGGYFRVGETEALFESLELVFGINVERVGDGRIVLSPGV
ncbi:MAG: FecR domain-containing protein [Pseudomonadales bacterium]|jgi:transmembrane sensor|nr:FecR domain-containing protein [Pseudomonadales bacterium]